MQTTGPASPEQPPAVDPAEAEVKVEEEVVVKADGEGEEGEQDEEKGGRGARRQRRRRAGAVVMVKRELLARCMTCPLCRRLLRDATTISECLHTCESLLAPPSLLRRPADPGGLEC